MGTISVQRVSVHSPPQVHVGGHVDLLWIISMIGSVADRSNVSTINTFTLWTITTAGSVVDLFNVPTIIWCTLWITMAGSAVDRVQCPDSQHVHLTDNNHGWIRGGSFQCPDNEHVHFTDKNHGWTHRVDHLNVPTINTSTFWIITTTGSVANSVNVPTTNSSTLWTTTIWLDP